MSKETIIKTDSKKYRVFITERTDLKERGLSFDIVNRKEVVVVEHDRQWDASPVIVDCCGDEQGRVYEVKGDIVDEFKYGSGRYGWTKAQVVEFVNERIEAHGRY